MKIRISKIITLFLIFTSSSIVAQDNIDDFFKQQPIIDMHFHITKGYVDNEVYNNRKVDIDSARIDWIIEDYHKNNVVLALGGGTLKYANMYVETDSLFWAGLVFPCMKTVEQDEP
ncbi:hypothetical protein, partial [Algibacter sp.]|uniref:hypothetical protein n=1 Tax=Algibacter sp. TaxID=1872428 RepID=UPI003C711BC9